MAGNGSAPISYSAALSGSSGNQSSTTQPAPSRPLPQQSQQPQNPPQQRRPHETPQKRSPSPSHRPQIQTEDEPVYVLTLLTDKPHHDRMTAFRKQYFPKHLNKLEAHLTLFHALPGSKLDSTVIPTILSVAQRTAPFKLRANKVMRMKRGLGIALAKTQGADQTKEVHAQLRDAWLQDGQRWLSEQDRGGLGHVHYTIMNKVDDVEDVERAQEEVEKSFKGDVGVAEGLVLFRYDRGFWRWERKFEFGGEAPSGA
ncbi:hypothetical protein KC332_g10017 [Hortaea werneckii]|uniref:Uncharacterized protein n=1 Tax=Hortaea werneckii TaxID=91943 RepID=A0A3M7IF49_HORWE|nr:hypothetical protein KC358_g9935 [Hortaea werneckii]KAI6822289.1 hypothetical protein KC350_g9406 [Hortaea werneckii]KAI6921755.1 hypothetical protein KC348_g10043 [Hortaea werneckii]KAI6931395.1 hypothetical protein KC341_g9640 [Hortaea werneckii]KAI6965633.1 hypothetical protein KC321_g10013 [Hortaea werneckii]